MDGTQDRVISVPVSPDHSMHIATGFTSFGFVLVRSRFFSVTYIGTQTIKENHLTAVYVVPRR